MEHGGETARGPRESTLPLLKDPYGFIASECRARGVDAFETRLFLGRAVCMTGRAAVELFYDPEKFKREGAAPEPLRATLFGKGAIQSTDGATHKSRKHLFLSIVAPARVDDLRASVESWWLSAARGWEREERVVLYDAMHVVLARAVCEWAGVPLPEADAPRRARDLALLFDGAAAKGIGHLQARLARARCEAWLSGVVGNVRKGRLIPQAKSALARITWHREDKGDVLPPRLAAVELLNLLRPTVAVSVYVVHVAHALRSHPECRDAVRERGQAYREAFIDEVRRYYPFFPSVVARAKESFEWGGARFPAGARVMLDLHGTNHDPRIWGDPEVFRPERFLAAQPDAFSFVPQGGGDPRKGHRCPGEGVTRMIMDVALDFLAERLRYDVPVQDLSIDLSRLPALPRSHFVIAGVKVLGTAADRSAGAASRAGASAHDAVHGSGGKEERPEGTARERTPGETGKTRLDAEE